MMKKIDIEDDNRLRYGTEKGILRAIEDCDVSYFKDEGVKSFFKEHEETLDELVEKGEVTREDADAIETLKYAEGYLYFLKGCERAATKLLHKASSEEEKEERTLTLDYIKRLLKFTSKEADKLLDELTDEQYDLYQKEAKLNDVRHGRG